MRRVRLLVLGSLLVALPNCVNRYPPAASQAVTNEVSVSDNTFVELTPVAPRNKYGVHDFRDVAILDNGVMWAVGYDGQDPRRMWRSRDGGHTWQRVSIQSSGFTLNSLDFPDTEHGFAVGGYGTIMITTDGGENWIQSRRPTKAQLDRVSFVNARVGYVAGSIGTYDRDTDTSTYGVEVLKTTDGGKTWRLCYRDRISGTVWQIVTPTEKTAFLLMDGNRVLRTGNGGRAWHEVLFKRHGPQSLTFTKDGIGWLVGPNLFYRSSDSGLTWKTPEELPDDLSSHQWSSIDFADEKIGMAVSEDCAIAMTYDGGLSWSEVKSTMHDGNAIWYDETIGFKEHLRSVRLHGESGLILGSQRLLRIEGIGNRN